MLEVEYFSPFKVDYGFTNSLKSYSLQYLLMNHAFKRNELIFWLLSSAAIERPLLGVRWLVAYRAHCHFQSHVRFPVFMTDGAQYL